MFATALRVAYRAIALSILPVVSCYAQTPTATAPKANQSRDAKAAPAQTPGEVERRRVAPEGVAYLVERVAITTNAGVTGFPPGTRVKILADHGEKILVSTEDTQFEVAGDKLTNDLDLAALVSRQDAESQEALARAMDERMAAYRAEKVKQIPLYEEQQRNVAARKAARDTATNRQKTLDRGAYDQKRALPDWWRPWMITRQSP
jgi:hypothetical protein